MTRNGSPMFFEMAVCTAIAQLKTGLIAWLWWLMTALCAVSIVVYFWGQRTDAALAKLRGEDKP